MTGRMLRAWRRRLALTQVAAGQRLGRHERMIGYYEEERYTIPPWLDLACMAIELETHLPGVAADMRRRLQLETM